MQTVPAAKRKLPSLPRPRPVCHSFVGEVRHWRSGVISARAAGAGACRPRLRRRACHRRDQLADLDRPAGFIRPASAREGACQRAQDLGGVRPVPQSSWPSRPRPRRLSCPDWPPLAAGSESGLRVHHHMVGRRPEQRVLSRLALRVPPGQTSTTVKLALKSTPVSC